MFPRNKVVGSEILTSALTREKQPFLRWYARFVDCLRFVAQLSNILASVVLKYIQTIISGLNWRKSLNFKETPDQNPC